ncbi:hypothetical protein F4604DRAFT_1683010 [Suillus subluteus]|nr:hypothetical protein F4604DRAFT_1683010 [Suillus subluteus]
MSGTLLARLGCSDYHSTASEPENLKRHSWASHSSWPPGKKNLKKAGDGMENSKLEGDDSPSTSQSDSELAGICATVVASTKSNIPRLKLPGSRCIDRCCTAAAQFIMTRPSKHWRVEDEETWQYRRSARSDGWNQRDCLAIMCILARRVVAAFNKPTSQNGDLACGTGRGDSSL